MEIVQVFDPVIDLLQKLLSLGTGISKAKQEKRRTLAQYVEATIDSYRSLYELLSNLTATAEENSNNRELKSALSKSEIIGKVYDKSCTFDMNRYYELTQEILFCQEKLDAAISEALGTQGLNEMQRLKLSNLWLEIVEGMLPPIFLNDELVKEILLQLSEITGLLEAVKKNLTYT